MAKKMRFEVSGSEEEIIVRARPMREFEGNPNYAADAAELYDFLVRLPHSTIVRLFERFLEDGSLRSGSHGFENARELERKYVELEDVANAGAGAKWTVTEAHQNALARIRKDRALLQAAHDRLKELGEPRGVLALREQIPANVDDRGGCGQGDR